jgi:hypothetical protein
MHEAWQHEMHDVQDRLTVLSAEGGHMRLRARLQGMCDIRFDSGPACSPVISFFVKFQECAVDPKAAPTTRHPSLH